jgi:hypothetical protein
MTAAGPIKLHSAPNKRSKFWLCSRFVFVLQGLPQLTGNYINRSPLYSVRTSPQCRPTVSNSGASKATRVAVAISLSLSLSGIRSGFGHSVVMELGCGLSQDSYYGDIQATRRSCTAGPDTKRRPPGCFPHPAQLSCRKSAPACVSRLLQP